MTEQQIAGYRRWFDIFKNNGDLVEIRLIDPVTSKTYSGYFKDIDTILKALQPYENCNQYFVLNRINEACYSRQQHDKFILKPRETTSDKDITAYEWIMVDIDVERTSGTASTDEELNYAKLKANDVYAYLRKENFEEPVICCSGSGIHMMYRVKLHNNEENRTLLKNFLDALGMLFSDERVKIDGVVANPSRLCRLYFSVNRKGANTPDRPHRMSYIVRAPEIVNHTKAEYIQRVASIIPTPEKPSRENHYRSSESFDLEGFLQKYDIKVAKKTETSEYVKYVLAECPFDPSHKAPDSAVFAFKNGGYQFVCLHNSHRNYNFRDFRLKFDPHAYDRSVYAEYVHKRNYYGQYVRPPFIPEPETEDKGPKWKKMGSVKRTELSLDNYILSGFTELDGSMIGFRRKHVSIWSGLRGSAKSSILNMVILNGAQRGFKSGLWSAELDDSEVKTWLFLQAAGKAFNKPSKFNNYFYTPQAVSDKIDPWIDQYFDLYEQNYGDNFLQLENDIKDLHSKDPHDQYIIDNVMCLDLSELDGDQYEKQKDLLKRLTKLAKELNVHIHLVAHPNKSLGFLRPNSISGSGNMPDLAQNIFICHRINTDFERAAADFLPKETLSDIISSGCTNVIEICKCRDKGAAVGKFIKLWFEIESNRLKSDPFEVVNYNWQEQYFQRSLDTDRPNYEIHDDIFTTTEEECPF